ncbi:FUSC family protein [Vibrio cholerae]
MFNATTKEALKASTSVVIALCLAMWFQWEKPYWAAIAVAVMALNETFAHSLQKGQNRLWGALLGVAYALLLIALFSQQRFLFIAFYTLLLASSLFMASDKKYGYIFVQGYTVCTIICCMGGFDSAYTFHFMILRVQETVLGIAVFTLVYKLLWPVTTQTVFIREYAKLHTQLYDCVTAAKQGVQQPDLPLASLDALEQSAQKLHHLLELPNNGSCELQFHQRQWLERMREIQVILHLLRSMEKQPSELCEYLDALQRNLDATKSDHTPERTLLPTSLLRLAKRYAQHMPVPHHRTLKTHLQEDWRKVAQGVCTFLIAIAVWIYLPVPGGFVFPMIAGIFATNLPPLPPGAIKDAFLGTLGLGVFYLGQYVFIMPSFTELWQLASFYFINLLAIWLVFDSPRWGIFRVLGVNLLLILTSSALNLAPSYSFNTPLMMMAYVLIVLVIANTVSRFFHPHVHFAHA